jgi:hypothetical protein
MEWTIVSREDDGYVSVVTRGVADQTGSLEMAHALTDVMRRHRLTNVVIDHRGVGRVEGLPSDVYDRPKIFRAIGASPGIRVAELIRAEHADHFAFFETVCRNQGFQFSVFTNEDEALDWLLGGARGRADSGHEA